MSGIKKTLKLVDLLTVKCQKCNASVAVTDTFFEGENEDGSLFVVCMDCLDNRVLCAGCEELLYIDEAYEISGSYFHEECYMDAGSQLREI